MRFFISIFIIGIACFVAGLFTPWWSVAVIAFLVSLLVPQKSGSAFGAAFIAVFLLWLLLAAFINAANAGILANRIGEMLGVGARPWLLIMISALVGGLVAGLAALTASFLRKEPVAD